MPAHPGRYRRRRLLALAALLALLVSAGFFGGRALLSHAGMFQVAQIDVDAPPGIDPDLVRAASGVRLGEPLLRVDLQAVGRAVADIPTVAAVEVARSWPSTLRVSVAGRTPVALTDSANGPWLVDHTGTAYLPAPTPAPALPLLICAHVGPGDPATMAGLAVLASLPPSILEKLQVVTADGPAAVTLRLAGGKQVRWGSPQDSARKASVLGVLLTQTGSVYDVSAPDLPTIRR
jgi:cell division protein FtsQ